jgi:hypothetical protein
MKTIKRAAHATIDCSCKAHELWTRKVALPLTKAYLGWLQEKFPLPGYTEEYWGQVANLAVATQVKMHEVVHDVVEGAPVVTSAKKLVNIYEDYLSKGISLGFANLEAA